MALISLQGLAEFKSKLPDFIASEGFIKNTVADLVNYYKKTETYSQSEVNQLIATVGQFGYEVVTELPEASESTLHKIYLVPADNPKIKNVKDEFITIDNGASAETRYTWEQIGSTEIDLSAYSTTAQMNEAIATAIAPFKTEAQIKAIVEAYGYQTTAAADLKYVEKETGKGLSTNDYTTAEKTKLAGIAAGAEVNVLEGVKIDTTPLAIGSDKTVSIATATNAEIDTLFQ